MADSDDFEYQLQQEALAAQRTETTANGGENAGVYTDNDGQQMEWDPVRKGWFPRITEDFLAQYQAGYGNYEETNNVEDQTVNANIPGPSREGPKAPKAVALDGRVIDESESEDEDDEGLQAQEQPVPEKTEEEPGRKRKAEEKEPSWFEEDDEHNTKVYVSNLPKDITEEEFVELMKKCGFIMKDDKGKLKVKLYKDAEGNNKGDGLCSFMKIESVGLALDLLDGSDVRGQSIKVERAKFELKGEYNPNLKPKKRKTNRRDKEKQKKKMEKLFDWRPDRLETERPANEKVVVIKNFFDPEIFTKDPKLILEYRKDLREECEERCGPVRKVDIYDLHPEGIAKVTFNEFDAADKCKELMDGRFFDKRRLEAAFWDGKTRYVVKETEEEIENRIKKWDEFLEGDGEEE